jgi:hypothetical protein
MKGSPRSLFLSGANRAVGWWMGHAANAVRQAQAAWMSAAAKAAKPKGKRASPKKRRR